MPVGDLFEGEAEVFQGLSVSITPFKLTKVAETLCIPFLETINRILDSRLCIKTIAFMQSKFLQIYHRNLCFFSAVLTFGTVTLFFFFGLSKSYLDVRAKLWPKHLVFMPSPRNEGYNCNKTWLHLPLYYRTDIKCPSTLRWFGGLLSLLRPPIGPKVLAS